MQDISWSGSWGSFSWRFSCKLGFPLLRVGSCCFISRIKQETVWRSLSMWMETCYPMSHLVKNNRWWRKQFHRFFKQFYDGVNIFIKIDHFIIHWSGQLGKKVFHTWNRGKSIILYVDLFTYLHFTLNSIRSNLPGTVTVAVVMVSITAVAVSETGSVVVGVEGIGTKIPTACERVL